MRARTSGSAGRGVLIGAAALFAAALLAPSASAAPYQIPDYDQDKNAELMLEDEFTKQYGSSNSNLLTPDRTDVSGPGVVFHMQLNSDGDNADGKIGIGDNWPVNSESAELAWDDGGSWHSGHDTSLADYDSYEMWVTYADGPTGSDIDASLYMNTGLCGGSGYPPDERNNDTAWAGPWTNLQLGETKKLGLDFDNAEAWNIRDNYTTKYKGQQGLEPHTGWDDRHVYDGMMYAINDRDRHEVTHIGIQIADFDYDTFGNDIDVHLNAVPEPASALLAAAAACAGGLAAVRRRRRS